MRKAFDKKGKIHYDKDNELPQKLRWTYVPETNDHL